MTIITISDLLASRRMLPRLRARDKKHAIQALAACIVRDAHVGEDALMRAVAGCADYTVCGPGTGVALLHAMVPGLEESLAAAACLRPPVDFGASDGSRTDIVVLLLSPPERAYLHLLALTCLARRLRRPDVTRYVRGVDDADSMYVVFTGDALDAPEPPGIAKPQMLNYS